ncbi:MAG: ribonuclease R [Pontibacterium sp.]
MAIDWIKEDPHAEEEMKKYGKPTPSRAFISSFLESYGQPLSHRRICKELGIEDAETAETLSHRLKAMCRDGQLMTNRKSQYCLISRMDLIQGRVIGHRDGFGFVTPDKGGDDLFLSAREMRKVFDGDKVLVQEVSEDHRGRKEGSIIEVLEHCTEKLVGRFSGSNGVGEINPENQRITQKILVLPDPANPLEYHDQQLVVVKITRQPGRRQMAQGQVIEVLGDHMAPGMEITVALHNYDVPHELPDQVKQEIGDLGAEVDESAKTNRIDLRHLPLVTIDGEDAKDFDDAVYAEKKRGGGWRLWVAIADVSWYVRPNSALDGEAFIRGNSVYFPEYVVPMLPELLSNGLCSLNPHVDRLAMVCEMTISAAGNLSGYKFYEAVIQSHARLTYNKVGTMLMEPESDETATARDTLREEYAAVVPHLENLYSLYHALRHSREQRGAIDFETTETRILFSEDRKIERIVPVKRNDAHKVIEECMLCANVATARFLAKLKRPAIYRIHEGPKEQKLVSLRGYLGELGLQLDGGEKPTPSHYQSLAEQIDERPDKHIIQTMMLRSMRQAVYSPDNLGHFGLAYSAYTHFTSPIRRYPDLLVHRLIRAAIHSESNDRSLMRPDDFETNPAFEVGYDMAQMLQYGEHCSMTERRADDATRDVMAWLKCEYMQSQVGEVYAGSISAVTGFGLFVELDDVYVEGLVHVTALPGDYYQFDAAKQRLVGERTRKKFALGDRVAVQVVRVDLDERKIDFEMSDIDPSELAPVPKGKAKQRSEKTSHTNAAKTPYAESADKPKSSTRKLKQRELLAMGKLSPDGKREGYGRKDEWESGREAPAKKRGAGAKAGNGRRKPKLSAAEKEQASHLTKVAGKSKKAQKRKASKKRK